MEDFYVTMRDMNVCINLCVFEIIEKEEEEEEERETVTTNDVD